MASNERARAVLGPAKLGRQPSPGGATHVDRRHRPGNSSRPHSSPDADRARTANHSLTLVAGLLGVIDTIRRPDARVHSLANLVTSAETRPLRQSAGRRARWCLTLLRSDALVAALLFDRQRPTKWRHPLLAKSETQPSTGRYLHSRRRVYPKPSGRRGRLCPVPAARPVGADARDWVASFRDHAASVWVDKRLLSV